MGQMASVAESAVLSDSHGPPGRAPHSPVTVDHRALLALGKGKRDVVALAQSSVRSQLAVEQRHSQSQVRNVRSKLERDRTWKPGPDQKKWLYALYERERKRSRRCLGSLAPASIFSASIA